MESGPKPTLHGLRSHSALLQAAVAGLISGGAYALLGVCIVLLYRMIGTLNFAQAAIGSFGAFVYLDSSAAGAPPMLAFAFGLSCATAVGASMGWVMATWFGDSSVQTRSSVTIAMLIGLLAVGFRVFGDQPYPVPDIFGSASMTLAGIVVPIGTMMMLGSAIAIAAAVTAFLYGTRTGTDLRALAERPVAAELLGIPARILTVAVWATTGAIAGFAVTVIAPTRTASFSGLSLLVLPGLAAALLGAFRSFPVTIAGGLVIGLVEGAASQVETISPYRSAISFVVILAALLWMQRSEVWDSAR